MAQSGMSCPWAVLGLHVGANESEVKKAYYKLAREWHPDKHSDASEEHRAHCKIVFQATKDAYDNVIASIASGAGRISPRPPEVDPDQVSATLKSLFRKAKTKACGRYRDVVKPPVTLATPIDGFRVMVRCVGDGNCGLYAIARAAETVGQRERLWPKDYDFMSLICDRQSRRWWVEKGDEYRAGANDGSHIIAAAAVLRCRMPESHWGSHRPYEFGHSISDADIDVIGKDLVGVRFNIHVRDKRGTVYVEHVGQTSPEVAVIHLVYTASGGGHYDWITEGPRDESRRGEEASSSVGAARVSGASGHPSTAGPSSSSHAMGPRSDEHATGGSPVPSGPTVEPKSNRAPEGRDCFFVVESDEEAESKPSGEGRASRPGHASAAQPRTEAAGPTTSPADDAGTSEPGGDGAGDPQGQPSDSEGHSPRAKRARTQDGSPPRSCGLDQYLQHESSFQSFVYTTADDFEWNGTDPAPNATNDLFTLVTNKHIEVISRCGQVTDLASNVAKAIVYTSLLHEHEAGVQEAGTLLELLEFMRAHVDGAYVTGSMCEWRRCTQTPSDVHLKINQILKIAATYFLTCAREPFSVQGTNELVKAVPRFGLAKNATDKDILASARKNTPSWGEVQAEVALKLRKVFSNARQAVFELFVQWFESPREEAPLTFAFSNGVAVFGFGRHPEQLLPSPVNNVYEKVPYALKAVVDDEVATVVRKYLISYYAGNKQTEMMERALEAIAYLGLAEGLDKVLVIKDTGRKGKTARAVLRKTVFGTRASQVGPGILTVDDEARKQLSQHLFARLIDFDEFSSRDTIIRTILCQLSGSSPVFLRKPFGKETDQINWRWPSLLLILSLNCVPRIDSSTGEALTGRIRVVDRCDVRFTDKQEDVDIQNCVFPVDYKTRKILAEPMAGGYYMEWYLRRFVKHHTFDAAMNYINHPPDVVMRASKAFLEEADSGIPANVPGPSIQQSSGEGSEPEALKLHQAILTKDIQQVKRWPAYLTQRDVNKSGTRDIPGGRLDQAARKNKSKWTESKWEYALRISKRAPELFYYSEAAQRLYYLPFDSVAYDEQFSDLGLPPWRANFELKGAVQWAEEEDPYADLHKCEEKLRIPAGQYVEYANRDALEKQIKFLEFLVRINGPGTRSYSQRLSVLRTYVARIENEGTRMAGGWYSFDVVYFRVAGVGRRYAYGPSIQWLHKEDRAAALGGIAGVVYIDQEAALFAQVLERKGSLPASHNIDRIEAYVANKKMFRDAHTRHEQIAFPDSAYSGKELVNMCAFGSKKALRSPHLYLMQKQLLEVCSHFLKRMEYSAIATAEHLNARRTPEWSKACVLLQTWEDEEVVRAEEVLQGMCQFRALIFDGVLLNVTCALGGNDLLQRINTKEHARWAMESLYNRPRWGYFVETANIASTRPSEVILNCVFQALLNLGFPRGLVLQVAGQLIDEQGSDPGFVSYADVSHRMPGRIEPATHIQTGAYIMHTHLPGTRIGHCVAAMVICDTDGRLRVNIKDGVADAVEMLLPADIAQDELPQFIECLADRFFLVHLGDVPQMNIADVCEHVFAAGLRADEQTDHKTVLRRPSAAVCKRPASHFRTVQAKAVHCGNCRGTGHRAGTCPHPCFACGKEHCYLDCPVPAARKRAAQMRARHRCSNPKNIAASRRKFRKGTAWVRQPWDPQHGEQTPDKRARKSANTVVDRTEISLADIYRMSETELTERLADLDFLQRPPACPQCKERPRAVKMGSDLRWCCCRSCRSTKVSVFKNGPLSHVKERVRPSIYEYAGILWCFAHNFTSVQAALCTGSPLRTVSRWYTMCRGECGWRERRHQDGIVFNAGNLERGFCEVEADATRIKCRHERGQHGEIMSTTHAGAIGFLQKNSLSLVVYPMEPVVVSAGSDGKPGAPPPERDDFVYPLVRKHIGRGVLLQSDGGSGGDGMGDKAVSYSPYAKAARAVTSESHTIFHGGVDHSAKQFSRFIAIDAENIEGFEGVQRSTSTGRRRIRAEVCTNHIESAWRILKKQIPKHLTYGNYVEDSENWLMLACWRLRIAGDPWIAFGRLLANKAEREGQAVNEELWTMSAESSDENE